MRKAPPCFVVTAALFGLALLLPRQAVAAWPTDPTVNVQVCTATGDQTSAQSVSDGVGGTIVTWQDYRNGNWDIYAQKVSAAGAAEWTTDGVALCTATGDQLSPTIASDGTGGAIITWQDKRSGNYDIYAQRISAAGAVQWTVNGVAVCSFGYWQERPMIIADGAGGAIVVWQDLRGGSYDIYAQRISAGGAAQWTADGVALCTATGDQWYPVLASDGASGAIVTWEDLRGVNFDIYARRISAAGAVQWTANGVALCTASSYQEYPTITADGAGGAIVTWLDGRSGESDIYAQEVSAAGAVRWTANGVALCTAGSYQEYPTITADGAGGAIVNWHDYRGSHDIYAQRISAAGTMQWVTNGVALCAATGEQLYPTVISDGAGGAIITWQDQRGGSYDTYAQRISSDGTVQWAIDGVVLCSATGDQISPTIVGDGAGGAIVTWQDQRSGNYDIYAQRVQGDGLLGGLAPTDVSGEAPLAFALEPMRPNPTRGGALPVQFRLPDAAPARLELLDVSGRRVAEREAGSLGVGHHTLDLREGRPLAPGLYLVRLTQGTNTRVTRVVVLR